MSVYVDNFRAAATVGRVKGRWSHLTADTPKELHEFAAWLGCRREWFQSARRWRLRSQAMTHAGARSSEVGDAR